MRRFSTPLLAISGFLLSAGGYAAAASDVWAPAASDSDLKAQIAAESYTPEERRNIQTMLELLSEPAGLDVKKERYFCEDYKAKGPKPYYILDRLYGKRDGIGPKALKDITRHVKNVIAKGDRAWAYYETTATPTAPIYGVSIVKPVTFFEAVFLRFDESGKICESSLIAQQGELYRQLGGKFSFPGKP